MSKRDEKEKAATALRRDRENKRVYDLVMDSVVSGNVETKEISKDTGISTYKVDKCIRENASISEKFYESRKGATSIATENMLAILNDRFHSKNWEVTKYVLSNFENETSKFMTEKDNGTVLLGTEGLKKIGLSFKIE